MLIDSSLAGIIPNIPNYKKLSPMIEQAIDGLETLKSSFSNCVNQLEAQRRSMYLAAKKIMNLRSKVLD